jgi:hypothetical protein
MLPTLLSAGCRRPMTNQSVDQTATSFDCAHLAHLSRQYHDAGMARRETKIMHTAIP